MPLVGTNAILIAAGLLTTGALVVGVQFLPPLTQPDAGTFPEFQHYRPLDGQRGLLEAKDSSGRTQVFDPAAYCREELPGVNCACFRQTAAQVLAGRNPRAAGWRYANDWDLARSQAESACR